EAEDEYHRSHLIAQDDPSRQGIVSTVSSAHPRVREPCVPEPVARMSNVAVHVVSATGKWGKGSCREGSSSQTCARGPDGWKPYNKATMTWRGSTCSQMFPTIYHHLYSY